MGDSILDQEGSAAAFLLRQAGVDARAKGVWGSGLLGVTQYDYGKTKLSGGWLRMAQNQIATFDPGVVGVYLNHSYFPPYPHDASGQPITDLFSASGQRMIAQQARALITILRSRGADVFFIAPVPAGIAANPDPDVWDPIWRGYVPVLRAMHVTVDNASRPLEAADGLRAETKPSCSGAQQRVRPPNDVHLTRFGAGLSGTALAGFVATVVRVNLRGDAAPGEDVAALVPTPDARGYWLVGCDGSVYHFGDAARVNGARAAVAGHHGVVTAAATPTGAGLWLVTSDGTIVAVGDARRLAFRGRPHLPIISATAAPDGAGLWATSAHGNVSTAGGAREHGGLGGVHLNGVIVGIAATRDGHGYWLVGSDGGIFAFGDARFHGSTGALKLNGAIVGLAPTPDDRGYWLVGSDGGVFAFGNARFLGTGTWHRPSGAAGADTATPGPTVGVVARRGAAQGYWIFGTTGRVVARGAVGRYGGDNNLALETQ